MINQWNIDSQTYEFTSREVKQLSFRLDGLFLPTDSDSQQPFYLVEVQFQPDEEFYYRLFAELSLFLRQFTDFSMFFDETINSYNSAINKILD